MHRLVRDLYKRFGVHLQPPPQCLRFSRLFGDIRSLIIFAWLMLFTLFTKTRTHCRIMHAGKDYPGGMELVRRKAKEQFRANAHLNDEGLIEVFPLSGICTTIRTEFLCMIDRAIFAHQHSCHVPRYSSTHNTTAFAEEIIRCVARGRWYVKNEIILTTQLKKYRTLKQRLFKHA